MTDISEIFTTPSVPNSTPEYKSDSEKDIMGKEDFLTLLVAQMKNQDPLNPEDATEFTSQLTEFSSLEQLQNLNKSVEGLVSSQKNSDKYATMTLLGKDVTYTDGDFTFEGDPVSIGYQLDGQAASVTITIQDDSGKTVSILHPTELEKGNHFLEWNGLDNEGNTLPGGKFKIVLQATAAGEDSTVAVSPLVRSQVTGIDLSDETNDAVLYTYAGAEISSGSIISIYEPTQSTYSSSNNDDESSEDNIESSDLELEEDNIANVTGTSPETTEESAPTDEEQIELDRILHSITG
ncbi:MAG TPA: flagellar hook assembly protein FlgD [Desulfocapsa sulfexigens]|nr:flagellar hook assembly protein FlgD [Desulfocapsa sulfexigens]